MDELTDEMVAEEAATGKAELWRHADVYGQPVVLVRADRHVSGEAPLEESKRMCIHVLVRAACGHTSLCGGPVSLRGMGQLVLGSIVGGL